MTLNLLIITDYNDKGVRDIRQQLNSSLRKSFLKMNVVEAEKN